MEAGGWPPSSYKWRGGGPPVAHLLPNAACFFFSLLASLSCCIPMAPTKRFLAAEKGKARQEGPGSPPPKRGRGRPRKHAATPAMAPRGRGRTPSGTGVILGGLSGVSPHSEGHSRWGSPCTEGRRVVVTWPPRPRFHSTEVLP